MSNGEIVAAIMAGLISLALYLEQRRGTSETKRGNESMRAVKELLELKMERHDDKNVEQDKRMDWITGKIEKTEGRVDNHEMRIHDAEVTLMRTQKQ